MLQSRIDAGISLMRSRMSSGLANMRTSVRAALDRVAGMFRSFVTRLERKSRSETGASPLGDVGLIVTLSSILIGTILAI